MVSKSVPPQIQDVHEKIADRAPSYTAWLLFFGRMKPAGFVFNSGPKFKEMRRFTLKTLRDLGFGKNTSEGIILEEWHKVKQEMEKMMEENDGIVELGYLFNKAALNIVWHITAGERFEYDDRKMEKMIYFLDLFILLGSKIMGKPLGLFPFLRFFPPYRTIFNEVASGMAECRKFVRETIEHHKENLDTENPKDYIDKFLIASKDNPELSEEDLPFCCVDLFFGGTETTSKSLMFALAMMISHPDVQDKVSREVSEVTGDKDVVSMGDRSSMPYTEATVNEIWRYCNVLPLTPPRKTSTKIHVGSFEIPKETVIMSSTYTLHMDQGYWGDPEVFRPERFISEGRFAHDERNIPFGVGKRRCLGESLARMENFLIFANLMKKFKFQSGDGTMPKERPVPGLTNGPQPFSMRIVKKKEE